MVTLAAGLNPQQQQALLAGTGPVLVLAGPGSGKTRVLTHRIAYLISELGVNPYNILAVTFTNKAAKEMNNRVESLLGGRPRGLTLGTFHSICARLLRQEAEHLPVNQNFVIYDSDDQISIVRQALKDLNIDEKMHRASGVHASISAAKNELALPEDMPINSYRDEVVARVYQRYQQTLLANNAMDFDDLLLWTAHLLDTNPEVRKKYAQRYEHILVDEFQDTNQAQYSLLKHLASEHRNIYVVGDTDQSIYRWRGADYRNVLRFEEDYPDAQVILLEQNYRSTQRILDAAMAVIDRNPHRTRKHLFTDRGTGAKVLYQQTLNEQETGKFIVNAIASMVAEGARTGDFAVMYRTNAQSRLIEEAFLYANLPYKLVGAQRFYGRREIKDVLSYLRLVFNPNDEVSLNRVINVPTRRIGIKSQAALRTIALQNRTTPGALLMHMGAHPEDPLFAPISTPTAQAMAGFGRKLAGWVQLAQSGTEPLPLMDRILTDIDYHGYLTADGPEDEAQDRWDNVQELRRLAAEYAGKALPEFLENIALVSDQDTIDESAEVPTLLTLHAAKGLEFGTVFITGLNDGVLPHQRALDDPEEMEEERRLFYVGITRAKDQLVLIHNMYRSNYGYAEGTLPSRFLDDLPDELIEGGNQARLEHPHRPDRWENPRQRSAPVLQTQFKPGMNVLHPTWGEGMVLNSRIQDDDELVDIFFQEVGLKKVMAAFANLKQLPKGKQT